MAQRLLRTYMSLSYATRVLWILALFEALSILARLAH
jgi:hypothetical protein